MDYYEVLGVGQDASMEKIKTAYKELARRWHPDKNLNDDKEECAEKFKKISEAYKALKDEWDSSSVRTIPSSRFTSNASPPSSLFGQGSSRTYPSDPSMDSLLHSIFRSPSKDTSEVLKNPQKNAKYDFHENQRSNRRGPSPYGSFTDPLFTSLSGRESAIKAAPIECCINCTHEELYVGTVKRILLKRDILDRSGKPMQMDEMLTINIKPGSKNGAKFIFKEKGNEKINTIPADIIVILNQKPHDLFTREVDDLILKETISLFEVLTCSCGVDFKTLDGRNLTVPINCVSFPFHEKVVKREGMPWANDPSKRGDLRIRLNVRLF